ncbi:MAG: hypothetical protein HQK57_10765 [Deltaproteobacteria bacterium]|nr:hypothetical protein [Deltaproteobacteria bacterium]
MGQDPRRLFRPGQIKIIDEATLVAEEVTCNFFKLSFGEWKGLRYDIKTLAFLTEEEVAPGVLAHLVKYTSSPEQHTSRASRIDFYRICLQDDNILDALQRDRRIELAPLALYVITHELVHIIRFSKFQQRFDLEPRERTWEETIVHNIATEILKPMNMPALQSVLSAYDPLTARSSSALDDRYLYAHDSF